MRESWQEPNNPKKPVTTAEEMAGANAMKPVMDELVARKAEHLTFGGKMEGIVKNEVVRMAENIGTKAELEEKKKNSAQQVTKATEAAREALVKIEQADTHTGVQESIKESLVLDAETLAMLEAKNSGGIFKKAGQALGKLVGRSSRPEYDVALMQHLVEASDVFVDRLYKLIQSGETDRTDKIFLDSLDISDEQKAKLKIEKPARAQLLNVGEQINEGVRYEIIHHKYNKKDEVFGGFSSLGNHIEINARVLGSCIEEIGRGRFDFVIDLLAVHRGVSLAGLVDLTSDELALLNDIALPARADNGNQKSIRALDEKLAPLGVMYGGPERGYIKVKQLTS